MAEFGGEAPANLTIDGFSNNEFSNAFERDLQAEGAETEESKGSLATIWSNVSLSLLSIPAFFYGIVLSGVTLFAIIALPNNQPLSAAIAVVSAVVLFGVLFLQFRARGRANVIERNRLERAYGEGVPL
nr:hypothetical protein [Sicyoidochytrium minutum DNA virus]